MAAKTASRDQKLKLNLEKLRTKRGVSLDTVTEATKISRYFLQAIEAEEFDKLPGGVFNTNYLRQYAVAVGYDASRLLEYYQSCIRCDEPEPAPKRALWTRWLRAVSPMG